MRAALAASASAMPLRKARASFLALPMLSCRRLLARSCARCSLSTRPIVSSRSHGRKEVSTSRTSGSKKRPMPPMVSKTRSWRSAMYPCAMPRLSTFSFMATSSACLAFFCSMRRCFSSARRCTAASRRCTSASSALRSISKAACCSRMASSSASSMISIMLFSSVFTTSTSSTGATSKSKSKRSPSRICVSLSTPDFFGTNSTGMGLSMPASVCVAASSSSARSARRSTYSSVWMSMCTRPGTGGGVDGRRFWPRLRRVASARRRRSSSSRSRSISRCCACVMTCAA
mmetsp:Transcript_724/g.1806  ORF Transcript_724/g.1806 Transcript_724/m.1806 type:complete len:288 (-) Transcript_724:306-1169(-)